MPRPKQHLSTNRRPCSGFIRAIYTRRTDDTGRIRWESLGWLCDTCHRWAESEWELTGYDTPYTARRPRPGDRRSEADSPWTEPAIQHGFPWAVDGRTRPQRS